MKTIADRMEVTHGRPTGFDYLRLILATSIIVWHAFPLSYGAGVDAAFMASPWRPLVACLVPMFFALSGFLVAGSLERNPIVTFLGLRIIRILPALFVEVALSALILGPLLTVYTLSNYFSDGQFAHYFLNVLGDIHYELPGLFLSNPYPNVVNGQLWTVPWELKCYLALTGLSLIGVSKSRWPLLGVTVLGAIAFWYFGSVGLLDQSRGIPGAALILSFLVGVIMFNMKNLIPWSGAIAVASAFAATGLFLIPGGDYFVAFPTAYLTIYLGLLNPPKFGVLKGADYSYGLYLYGFAIQQAIAQMGPWAHHWYVNLCLALPFAAIFAGLSWTFIEKPALKLKQVLPHVERGLSSLWRRNKAGETCSGMHQSTPTNGKPAAVRLVSKR